MTLDQLTSRLRVRVEALHAAIGLHSVSRPGSREHFERELPTAEGVLAVAERFEAWITRLDTTQQQQQADCTCFAMGLSTMGYSPRCPVHGKGDS